MFFKNSFLASAGFLLLFTAFATSAAGGTPTPWSYHGSAGPEHWGELDKRYQACNLSKEQSPINITDSTVTDRNPLKIHYITSAAQAVNDEYSSLNIHGKKTLINDGHTLQINLPKNASQEYIDINNNSYQLIQFHFHTPSENHMNNKSFPIEIHFVNQSKEGDLAVLGVMLLVGKYNVALQNLIDELPANKHALKIANKIVLSIGDLLPQDESYYTFTGSLTTPPCSEAVRWFVFSTPVEASLLQINQLKTLLPVNNARPVQALNKREILQFIDHK